MANAYRIKLRRDTSDYWTVVNPVLEAGEPGFETDTGLLKVGNGTDAWNDLNYLSGEADLSGYLTEASASTTYATQTYVDTAVENISLDGYLTEASASTTYAKINNPTITGTVSFPGNIQTYRTFQYQETPVEFSGSGSVTLTPENLLAGIIRKTASSPLNFYVPTGASLDSAILSGNLPVGYSFDWYYIGYFSNSGDVNIYENTNHTVVSHSGNFGNTINPQLRIKLRTVKTATNTFVTYALT